MEWFVQIVLALQYIHSEKILHRDLKTANIFLTHQNVLKLGDFGISAQLENTLDMYGAHTHLSPSNLRARNAIGSHNYRFEASMRAIL
jgi:NIMA (never in mitosis gene a)-related kinase